MSNTSLRRDKQTFEDVIAEKVRENVVPLFVRHTHATYGEESQKDVREGLRDNNPDYEW